MIRLKIWFVYSKKQQWLSPLEILPRQGFHEDSALDCRKAETTADGRKPEQRGTVRITNRHFV